MKFGPIRIDEAEGAILAHTQRAGGKSLKKGRALSEADVEQLRAAGTQAVVAARLEEGDVPEDAAATALAEAVCGPGLRRHHAFTGRCNLYALHRGVVIYPRDRLDRLNHEHEALTVACLPPYAVVTHEQMVATIKIIPFSAPRAALERACAIATEPSPLVEVKAFRERRVGLVQTRLAGTKESVLDKTRAVLGNRIEPLGGSFVPEIRCAHEETGVAAAVASLIAAEVGLILIAGASAIVDRRDVIPAGIEQAGGTVLHFGMPMDPGNLLLLARHGTVPVLGLPGCARSPKYNGLDTLLARLAADLPVGSTDIMGMGAGGLLEDIPERPAPRVRSGNASPPGR